MVKPNWDSIQLYFSGDEYFRDLIHSIHAAKDEIILESYIFDMDPIGLRVLKALSMAQSRGVKVQILVDGVGSFNWIWSLREYCKVHNLHLRIYHPIPLKADILRKISWRNLRRILFLLRRVNKRLHRKVILIDRRVAFAGSMNISQVHTKEFLTKQAWRDTGVRMTGSPLVHLRKACLKAWVTARAEHAALPQSLFNLTPRLQQHPGEVLRLNSNLKWRYFLLRDLNRRIRTSQSRILITNAYFLPRPSVLRALIKAAQRGVYVGLCLPAVTDVPIVRWASRSLYNRLLRAGVHIHEYQQKVLHAKTLIIDDWATVGSHNLNHRSLTHDLEVEVALTEKQWVDTLANQWEADLKNSKPITSMDIGRLMLWERIIARLAYWFRYWL
jgi:cardiolipin synthase